VYSGADRLNVNGLLEKIERKLRARRKRRFQTEPLPECSVRDPNFRRGEKMPLEAARAIMQAGHSHEDDWDDETPNVVGLGCQNTVRPAVGGKLNFVTVESRDMKLGRDEMSPM
jgi:hypothetical protein